MRFTYTYRSSDGERHSAEIEAESRDAAFAAIRAEMGVKPIRVVAAGDGDGRGGEGRASSRPDDSKRTTARWVVGVLIAAAIAGGAWWWAARRAPQPEGQGRPADGGEAPITVATSQGPVTLTVAAPLPRQTIPGNRQRVGEAAASLAHPVERLLARYAEPGRAVAAPAGEKPTEADFEACLREPIRIASTDFTEAVDLKRIVAGMKREMRAYIAGGGTVEQYLAELAERQFRIFEREPSAAATRWERDFGRGRIESASVALPSAPSAK